MQTRDSWNPYTATRTRTSLYVNAPLVDISGCGRRKVLYTVTVCDLAGVVYPYR